MVKKILFAVLMAVLISPVFGQVSRNSIEYEGDVIVISDANENRILTGSYGAIWDKEASCIYLKIGSFYSRHDYLRQYNEGGTSYFAIKKYNVNNVQEPNMIITISYETGFIIRIFLNDEESIIITAKEVYDTLPREQLYIPRPVLK